MKIYRTAFFISLLLGGGIQAQNQPSPAEAKLKEMVKSLTQRVSQAEQDAAKVTAEKQAAEAKIEDLEKTMKKDYDELKKKTEEMSQLREEKAKMAADFTAELGKKNEDLLKHQKSLAEWKAAHTEISGIAKKKEAERAKQAGIASALERRVQDLRMRNGAMYETANEILNRYKSFGLGEAIAAREPFTGNMRIKLKNQVQEHADALLDATADSKRTPANAPAAQPAAEIKAATPVTPPASPAPVAAEPATKKP
jgi:chromosome segregation ATPase